MADIRINALATTATSAASDDYVALDGAANGTRKILASNIAQNVSDVVLGVNGPSVKSSLDARAARQGLVFDGTNVTTGVAAGALGTGDFTISWWQNVQNNANGYGTLFGGGSGPVIQNFDGSGRLQIIRGDGIGGSLSSSSAVVTGKWEFWTIVRSSGTATWYKNGVADGSGSLGSDFTGNSYVWGRGGSYVIQGSVSGCLIYNRALSASEVVSLFEAGVPAGADYNTASNTAINTSAIINSGNPNFDYDTFSGASATGFTAAQTSSPNGSFASVNGSQYSIVTGTRYLVTFNLTLTSGTAPKVSFGSSITSNLSSNVHTATAGSNSVILTVTATGSRDLYIYNAAGESTSFSISSLSVTRLGLLLAPDAGQAGGGLAWYDTSGNAASITLPASGVSWNVPSSQKTASGWTFGGNLATSGNLTVSGTTGNFANELFNTRSATPLALFGPATGSPELGGNYYYSGTTPKRYASGYASRIQFGNGITMSVAGTAGADSTITYTDALTLSNAGNTTLAGNLTVSGGTLLNSVAGATNAVTNTYATGSASIAQLDVKSGDGTTSSRTSRILIRTDETTPQRWDVGLASSKNLTIGNSTLGSNALTIDSSNNAITLGGNLTVSGTTGVTVSAANAAFLQSNSQSGFGSASALISGGSAVDTALTCYVSSALVFGKTASSEFARFAASTGNLLLGTTTDSGNGKLQLATHSDKSGGIGFGTDTSLYRAADGQLWINTASGNNPALKLASAGTQYAWLEYYAPDNAAYLNSASGKSLALRTNGGFTALTLDSSQRTILSGPLRLANAYAAGAPAATGYVTIQDSSGTTYKVLVST